MLKQGLVPLSVFRIQGEKSAQVDRGWYWGFGACETMSTANKRIPVTEERWKELNELKSAGETYDELLESLIQEHNRRHLANVAREVREADEEDLTPLDEL